MVAVAMTWRVALRRPLRKSGSAMGASTLVSTCQPVMPIPRAASRAAGSTLSMPAAVPDSRGGIALDERPDEHRHGEEQPQGRYGPGGVGARDEPAQASGVAHPGAERHGDDESDEQGQPGEEQVLEHAVGHAVGALPVGRVGEPGPDRREAHAATALVHGVSTRDTTWMTRSKTSARSKHATMPTHTSVGKERA